MANLTSYTELSQSILQLEEVILSKHPRLPALLRDIHSALSAQPENVTLLKESEIQIIVQGLQIQTRTEFSQAALKPAAQKSAAAKIKALGAAAF